MEVKRRMESSGTTQPAPTKSALPTAAGVLLILAGILGLAFWGLVVVGGAASTTAQIESIPGFTEAMAGMLIVCGVIGIIFSLIALLGGIMAVQRKNWAYALIGGILGLFTIGFFLGSILALIGLILVAVSKKDFV